MGLRIRSERIRIAWSLLTPSAPSMMSFPTEASVVHLQLASDLDAHLLCALALQISQLRPAKVTPARNGRADELNITTRVCCACFAKCQLYTTTAGKLPESGAFYR